MCVKYMQFKDFIFNPVRNFPLSLKQVKTTEGKLKAFSANSNKILKYFSYFIWVRKCVSMKFILNKIHYMNL